MKIDGDGSSPYVVDVPNVIPLHQLLRDMALAGVVVGHDGPPPPMRRHTYDLPSEYIMPTTLYGITPPQRRPCVCDRHRRRSEETRREVSGETVEEDGEELEG